MLLKGLAACFVAVIEAMTIPSSTSSVNGVILDAHTQTGKGNHLLLEV